ncbi:MAG: preprotein translocase subunit SecA [Pseudomonadota bacterium]|nr:preprotein translocase subunit SecA [Pseudomonadota bacterium]
MFSKLLKSIFGSSNDRAIRQLNRIVGKINKAEDKYKNLSDAELFNNTKILKDRITNGDVLDDVLIEAFATVRETSSRTLKMRHFDVQILGGLVLNQGQIAEMKTGEGKTLVATLPAYFNALCDNSVHIITVNDYLAKRDASWMAPIYNTLGLTVGIIQSYQGSGSANSFIINTSGEINECSRAEAYNADVTYGTNNEFGFDYLRDNMALRLEDKVQRDLSFAIVDEVDSILIDEARTPLVISGATKNSSIIYKKMSKLILGLDLVTPSEESNESDDSENLEGDFTLDEKSRSVELTEDGHQKIEEILINAGLLEQNQNLYQASNLALLHHVNSALRAKYLFTKDVEYLIKDGQAVLIDEHTGRTMPGRRLSDGLHQAIEAKENLHIQQESQTLASTTFQNYFRLYEKLSGMTGTADTEAFEFQQIYNLKVAVIPTNTIVVRKDEDDIIFLTQKEKFEAVIDDIKLIIEKGAPVLVGTASVETSEMLSKMLKKNKVDHKVLNAKQHELEATIIVNAGKPGAVTIATNMAGRGTDIVLGGNFEAEVSELRKQKNVTENQLAELKLHWEQRHQKVVDAGGLHIIATERHESRRIDNQLRGRAGRQGDPGVSRFYLSLEDPLMRLFASDTVKNMMRRMGMEYGESISHKMVTSSIVKAQRKVEGRNFDIRKHLLEYDDVANDQRQVIYQQRRDILEDEEISEIISAIREDVINSCISRFIPIMSVDEQWDIKGLEDALMKDFGVRLAVSQWLEADNRLDEQGLRQRIVSLVEDEYQAKYSQFGEQIKDIERQVMLQVVDTLWKDHLSSMEQLRQGIGLRAYAQKNPKQEYKRESFRLFEELLDKIKYETIRYLSHLKFASDEEIRELERRRALEQKDRDYKHAKVAGINDDESESVSQRDNVKPVVREGPKVGRNDQCPCGSGKKYKHCCGKI